MEPTSVCNAQRSRTHLFMVRVWTEDLGDGKTEWRGQVKHVLSGEVQYFREWRTLLAFLHEALMKDMGKNHLCPSLLNEGDDNDDN